MLSAPIHRRSSRSTKADPDSPGAGAPPSAWAGIPLFLQRAAEPGAAEEQPEADASPEERDSASGEGADRDWGNDTGAQGEAPSEDAAGEGAASDESSEGAPPPDPGESGAQEQGDQGDAGGGDGADGGATVQMKCACGGTCESCRAASGIDPSEAESERAVVQREALPGDDAPAPMLPRRLLHELGAGTPLPPAVSARFAAAFGQTFEHVRVHEATAVAPALRARAFTIGHHIAFAPGEFRPGTAKGDRLIAHELTHVVQQSGGRGTVQSTGIGRGGYEAEADRAADTAVRGGRVRAVTPVRRKAVQREGVGDFLEERAWGFVRDHFPDLEPYLRNPGRIWTSIVDAVGEGVGNLVNRVLGAIRNFHPLDALKGLFGPLVTAAATAFKTKDCGPFFAAVNQFRAKIAAFTAGPLGVLKRKFAAIKRTVRGMISKVTAPIGKLLRKVGGVIYKNIRATASRIGGLIQKAKDWSSRAWSWVKGKLGLNDESSSEGIWTWVKRKAAEAWEKAKPRLLPWLGPLKTVATVLLVLSPFGPIVLAIKFGPKIVGWLTSLYDQLHVPERITAARAAIARSMPAITRGLARGALMLTGIPLAIAGLHRAATVLHSLGNALAGTSLLGFAGDAVKFVATKIEEGVTWVGGPVKSAIHGIEEGLKHAGGWLDKIGQGAAKLISIVLNPFGIVGFLAGELWLAIPQCFKLPILNWILDLLIGLVRAIPVNPVLGPLFPLFLHAVVGFLQRVRGGDSNDEKVRVSDRLARLATGSASFILGLLWGVVKGVGEGLLMPFTMLYDVITAIPKVVDFVNGLPSRILAALGNIAEGVADAAQSAIDGFWPAVRSALRSPGGGILEWLQKAWAALTGAAEGVGGAVAGALIGFIMLSDFDLGEKLGWVAGTVLFELVLAYISGGASVLLKSASVPLRMLGKVLRVVVKAHEIMNKVFGLVFKALEPALNGIKALVKDLLPTLESKLTAILKKFEELIGAAKTAGEEFAGRFAGQEALGAARGLEGGAAALATGGEGAVTREGGGTAADTAGGAAREHPPGEVDVPATDTPPTRAADDAGAGAADRPRTADGAPAGEGRTAEADNAAARTREEGVAASGKQEHISQAQADAEMEFLADNPHLIEGTPPNRRATIGEHEWRENPSGGWCRYSGDPTQCRIGGPPGIAEATVDAAAIEHRLEALEDVPLPKKLRQQFQEAAAAVRAKAATDPEAAEAMLEALEAKLQRRGADLGADTEARELLQGPKADEYDLPGRGEAPLEDQLSPLDRPRGAPPIRAEAQGLTGEARHAEEVVPRPPRRASTIYPNATLADMREQLLRGRISLEEFARMFPEEGASQVFLPTAEGGRYIDHMYVDGGGVVLRESKNVGTFRLLEDYRTQLAKDLNIVGVFGGRVEWRISGDIDAEALDTLRQLAAENPRFSFVLDRPGPYTYAGGRYVVPRGVPEVTTIQRALDSDAAPAAEPAYAAAHLGVEGAREPLPHLDRIQAAFGGHDLSGVRTQTGGPATEANEELGSRGYTLGDRIGFSSAPDLRLAAHEATHVVQQRSGIQLEGGIDRPGDPYERRADMVADAVVRGESAGPLVAPMAGATGGTSPRPPIQRDALSTVAGLLFPTGGALSYATSALAPAAAAVTPKPPSPEQLRQMMETYLLYNTRNVWAAVGEHMLSVQLPTPHARLTWVDHRAFVEKMLKQLESWIEFVKIDQLDEILYPTNTAKTIGDLLPTTREWAPGVGIAIAHALHIAVVGSLKRLAERYLAVADSQGASGEDRVRVDELVTSWPIDRFIAPALCAPRAVTVEPLDAKAAQAAKGRPVGIKDVTLSFEGARDRSLWNWVRAESPADATAEDVAAKVWRVTDQHGDTISSFSSYLLAAAPPLFGIPKRFAIKSSVLKQYAPSDALVGEDSVDAQLLQIAGSKLTDEMVLRGQPPAMPVPAGAKPAEPQLSAVQTTFNDCALQLAFLQKELKPWGLAAQVNPAIAFVARKPADLATIDPKSLAAWSAVAEGQKERLTRISGSAHNVSVSAQKLGVTDPGSPQAGPVREILELFAVAAGVSHLAQASEAKLAQGLELQSGLNVRALQSTEVGMMSELQKVHEAVSEFQRVDKKGRDPWHVADLSHQAILLQELSRRMQAQMLSGVDIDPEEFEDVSRRSQEIALESRVAGTLAALATLNEASIEASKGDAAIIASMFSGEFRDLPSLTRHIHDAIRPTYSHLHNVRKEFDEEERLGQSPERRKQQREYRRQVLAEAQKTFERLSDEKGLKTFFSHAQELIENQQFRTACVQVAAMIGISLIGGGIAGLAGRFVGGVLMEATGASTLSELSLAARAGKFVTQVGVETTISSAGQAAVQGTSFTEAWKENLIMSLGTSAVFGSISHYAAEQARLEGKIAATWASSGKLGKLFIVGKEISSIGVHTLWGVAMGSVAHRIVAGEAQPAPATMREWALQSVSVAVGKHISERLTTKLKVYQALEQHFEDKGRGLVLSARKLQAFAEEVVRGKKPAVDLLEQHEAFLRKEMDAVDEAIAKSHGLPDELYAARQSLKLEEEAARSEATLDTKFALLGLEELVPGALWKGGKDEIDRAVALARKRDPTVEVSHDEASGVWRIKGKDRTIEIHSTEPELRTRPEEPAEAPGKQRATGEKQPAGPLAERPVEDRTEPLPKGGKAQVAEEGYCEICHSPCKKEVDMARHVLTAVEEHGSPTDVRRARNLETRIKLLDSAMEESRSRGTLKTEFRDRFAEAFRKLSHEIDAAYELWVVNPVERRPGSWDPGTEEIESREASRREHGMMDDPNWGVSPERAREGTAYHERIEEAIIGRLPRGSAFSENTIQEYLKRQGVAASAIPDRSAGIDLYILDNTRNLIYPVDVIHVAGGERHVAKLHRDVSRLRTALERVGMHLAEPFEIEYVGKTLDEAAASVEHELKAYARPPADPRGRPGRR